jgi:hypothetical protein
MPSQYALCFRFLFRRHLVLTRTSGIQGCRVPELGSQHFEQASVHVRANNYERCTAYRGVCCRAGHARAVFRLSCVYIPIATLQQSLTYFAVRSLVVTNLWPEWTDIDLYAQHSNSYRATEHCFSALPRARTHGARVNRDHVRKATQGGKLARPCRLCEGFGAGASKTTRSRFPSTSS